MGLSSVDRLANVIAGDNAVGVVESCRRGGAGWVSCCSWLDVLLHVFIFVNGLFDMFMSPASSTRRLASASRLRLHNRSLHSSIHNFLLLCDSAVMFRELKLVREMRAGRAAALGGGFAPQDSRLEKLPA